jgi:hypothetical protein
VFVYQQPVPVQRTQRKINTLEVRVFGAEKMGIKQQLDNARISVDIITEEDARALYAGKLDSNKV